MTETWTNTNDISLELRGYSSIIKSRDNGKHGGGVAIYINHEYGNNFKIRNDLVTEPHSESLFIQLNQRTKDVIIGVGYKPPDANVDLFSKSIEKIL